MQEQSTVATGRMGPLAPGEESGYYDQMGNPIHKDDVKTGVIVFDGGGFPLRVKAPAQAIEGVNYPAETEALPQWQYDQIMGNNGGSGHSTSTSYNTSNSFSTSQYIPNAIDRINAFVDSINAAVNAGQLDLQTATQLFNAEATKIRDELDVLTTNAANQVTTAGQQVQAAGYQMEDERSRAATNVQRGVDLAATRERAGESFMSDFAPYALPQGVNLNLPLVGNTFGSPSSNPGFNMGNVPMNTFNPDQVYGTAAMNAVPTMAPNSSVQMPNPVAPVIPAPDPGRYPQMPNNFAPGLDGIDWNAMLQRALSMA